MIYIDSSVVLAYLLSETRIPDAKLWQEPLISSRLIEYETRSVLHGRSAALTLRSYARELLVRIDFIELQPIVLHKIIEGFPVTVRTLDGIHLATMDFIQSQGMKIRLATYDQRLGKAALAIGINMASEFIPVQ